MPAWLLSIVTHWGFKALSIVLASALVAGGLFVVYRGIHNKAYTSGYQQALKDHPQNIYNGPTTVIQGKQMSCFPIKLGRFGFGVCHE